jgi:hypothetical protein
MQAAFGERAMREMRCKPPPQALREFMFSSCLPSFLPPRFFNASILCPKVLSNAYMHWSSSCCWCSRATFSSPRTLTVDLQQNKNIKFQPKSLKIHLRGVQCTTKHRNAFVHRTRLCREHENFFSG